MYKIYVCIQFIYIRTFAHDVFIDVLINNFMYVLIYIMYHIHKYKRYLLHTPINDIQLFLKIYLDISNVTMYIYIHIYHVQVESSFKALGVAMRQAVSRDDTAGVPSTKGVLA
jgi:imidazoleglycerol phosphate dehydratase HisB